MVLALTKCCYNFLPGKCMTIHTQEAIAYFSSLYPNVLVLLEIFFPK